jgi:hypothetical protein
MAAGVPRENPLAAMARQLRAHRAIRHQRSKMVFHFRAIAREQKILSRVEQVFGIVPGSRDQRDSAG